MDQRLAITWLDHGTFLLTSPTGKQILVDPWLDGNSACPREWKCVRRADLILVTHGHVDHLVQVTRDTGAPVVAIVEICRWLEAKVLRRVCPMNKGGCLTLDGIDVDMVPADHSSWLVEEDGRIVYLGEPVGFVLGFEDGLCAKVAGDTAVLGDMALIRRLYAPDIAFLPIGDRFTMGPEGAAVACELLGVRRVVPMHDGTFPALAGTPARLRELVEPHGITVLELRPGETTS